MWAYHLGRVRRTFLEGLSSIPTLWLFGVFQASRFMTYGMVLGVCVCVCACVPDPSAVSCWGSLMFVCNFNVCVTPVGILFFQRSDPGI